MDTQRIKYFLSVYQKGSFSRAAIACHISQPSLSNQIIKLENEVGGTLFTRDRNGVTLTELGEGFLPHAQAIMSAVINAYEFTEHTQSVLQRPIRIGAIPTIAPYLLPSLLECIKKHHPEAEFDILEDTTSAQLEAFRNRQLDFSLISPPTELDPQLTHLDLLQDELLLTLPEDHPNSDDSAVKLSDLTRDHLILLNDEHCLSQQTRTYCKSVGAQAAVSVRSSQISTLLGFVETGLGYTFTPSLACPTFQNRRVTYHSLSPTPYHRLIRLAWHRDNESSLTHHLLLPTLQLWSRHLTKQSL